MTILDLIKQSAVTLNITDILDIEKSLDPSYGIDDSVVESNFEFKRLYEMAKIVIKEVYSYVHAGFEKLPHVGNYLEELQLYDGKVAEDVYLFGLNSYYCLAVGLFEEYNLYYKRYQERLNRIKNLKLFAMPCRSWHE